MSRTEVTILGLGNILMQDEGIGVHIANLLNDEFEFTPPISIIDGGTTGSDLLPYFDDSKKVLILDAVNFGKKPGYIETINDDDILAMLTSKISLHHLGLSDVLSMTKMLDIKPEAIALVGIQPYKMELDLQVSSVLKERFDQILKEALSVLSGWGISWTKKQGT
jgi:hydrogenase maturation protease